jgi:galactokinase
MTMDPKVIRTLFRDLTGGSPDVIAFAPGRVNLIGEHTDYNEGYVLPAALSRGVAVAARRIPGNGFVLHSADLPAVTRFPLDAIERDPLNPWADYFKGVAWALFIRGLPLVPCEAVVTGDLPQGAGLSSSAAYEVATVLALKELSGFDLPSLEVAKVAREAENGFVGVACGIMDQVASVFGEKGCALLLDCRTLAREVVALPPGLKVVVVESGVKHDLASSEYNARRAECARGVKALGAVLPGTSSLRDVTPEDVERNAGSMDPVARKRCRHVVRENTRVLSAVKALRSGDRESLRSLLLDSHYSLRDDYEVSCPELDVLVEVAVTLPYCYGSRMTGAGFGGCTVNLVDEGAVAPFTRAVEAGYRSRTGRQARVHVFEPAAGARRLDPAADA